MGDVDIVALGQPIGEEDPCGPNLEYDPVFQDLERAAEGKPETQFADAEPPDWKQVKSLALQLLQRSKDLRVVASLSNAVLELDGWPPFAASVALMQQLLTNYWDQVHPQLDPDDGDPTLRVNAIAALCHPAGTLHSVRTVPLVSSPRVGRFSFRDIEIATGKVSVDLPEDEQPKLTAVNAAFLDADIEALKTDATALEEAANSIRAIEATLTDRLGSSQAPDLSDLSNELSNCHRIVIEQLAARGVGQGSAESTGAAADADTETAPGAVAAAAGPPSGEIRNREDIVQLLDKICDYYSRFEPASPVPLLLIRARRLVRMDFLAIMRDLAPDAVAQVEALRGQSGETDE